MLGGREQDVGGLDVAVQDAATMGMLNGLGQQQNQSSGKWGIKRPSVLPEPIVQPILERGPLAVCQYEETESFDFVGFIYGQNVRVLEASQGLGFSKKTRPQGGIGEDAGSGDFDCDLAAQSAIESQIDNAKGSRAECANDFVRP